MNSRLAMEANGLERDVNKLLSEIEANYNLLDRNEFIEQGRLLIRKIKMLNIEIDPYSKDALDYVVKRNEEHSEDESGPIGLSEVEKSRKHKNYASKLKASIKLYLNLNDKLEEEIKQISHLDPASYDTTFEVPSVDEIKLLQKKLSRYEGEMSKFDKRYPWLREPKFNLPNISNDIDKLLELRKKKSDLMEQLNSYGGLSPNMTEAKLQLSELRSEFTETNKIFLK